MSVSVEPWPFYSDEGGPPSWWVQVITTKRTLRLIWSGRNGRFARSWSSMHLRRSAPTVYREAVEFMQTFCSKMQRQGAGESVTTRRDASVEKRDASGFEVTEKRDTLAGARTLRVLSRVSQHSRDCDASSVTRDSDSPPLRCEAITVTQASAVERQQEHKARLAQDPRFAAWTASEPEASCARVLGAAS